MKNTFPFFFTLYMAVFAEPTYACSLGPNYLGSSNYEMVDSTELIIIAKAESVSPIEKSIDSDSSSNLPKVRFSILEVLKGSSTDRTVDIRGWVDNYRGRSDSVDFSKARPGAMGGSCIAYDYKLGANFLLFLTNHDGNWYISGGAFSRANEEVTLSNSPWTDAVKRYIKISQLDDYKKEKAALKAIMTSEDQSTETLGMVRDVENHFKIISVHKSFNDLNAMLNSSVQNERIRQKVLWAMARAHPKSAKPVFEKLLSNGKWEDYPGQVSMNLASNERKDMLPLLVNHFSKNSAYIVRMVEKDELSEAERTLIRKARKGLTFILKSIVVLTDRNNAKVIFNKLLETQDENTINSMYLWITDENPSLKSEFVKVLEKITSSNKDNETASRVLTYLKD